ncbi:hypothetical protein GRI58_12140 [Porphyrobacter algicida]|uniref:DUF4238 domain-containing protein n=1 Tax=Qipengyuania algicida TaxID=1836209 RepID=A0A845ARQ5_9SPHN|nr:hypothetical protein [Qipengyuania algicida]MXP29568.1 hypothetical protein [Qipengyuania algicida]
MALVKVLTYLKIMSTRSERTQKGNPHQLTIRQHVYPRASIDRFVDAGGVDLYDLKQHLLRRAKPDDPMFCADRAWGHGPEAGWMKDIEDAFQDLVEKLLAGLLDVFDEKQSATISDFYALWQARAERRRLPSQRVPAAEGVLGTRLDYTEDDLEKLEKAGISAFRGDGTISMRHLMGPVIRLAMFRIIDGLDGRTWRTVTTNAGEFCVPDVPAHGIIPLTPTVALHSTRSGVMGFEDLIHVNWCLASKSREYLFARSLKKCPGLA